MEMHVEFHALDAATALAREMEVELAAEPEFREFALEQLAGRAEIAERANGHVAADAGEAVEKESAHGMGERVGSRRKWHTDFFSAMSPLR
jgi:hypothetical protein